MCCTKGQKCNAVYILVSCHYILLTTILVESVVKCSGGVEVEHHTVEFVLDVGT